MTLFVSVLLYVIVKEANQVDVVWFYRASDLPDDITSQYQLDCSEMVLSDHNDVIAVCNVTKVKHVPHEIIFRNS